MFRIQTMNTISAIGLNQFPRELYEIASEIQHPDAILVRSKPLDAASIPPSVKVVGRAGAGLNNIPLDALTKRGIPVFNTPGANANAVRELVLAGMLLASRNICQAWHYVNQLTHSENLLDQIEQHKKLFVGFELQGKILGVIGLGSIGVKVANAALQLGMKVIGYDPAITVNRAWELSAEVKKAFNIDDLLMESDFVSLHVPLTDATHHMINRSRLQLMKDQIILLNFARDGIIDNEALLEALQAEKVQAFVTDFPSPQLRSHPRVINLPHLGASTREAEENCAVMIAQQVRHFLENGSIINSVNFPNLEISPHKTGIRLAIVNENIPNMVAQISAKLATVGLNISSLMNQSRDQIAYTIIDLAEQVNTKILDEIAKIPGILQLRMLGMKQSS